MSFFLLSTLHTVVVYLVLLRLMSLRDCWLKSTVVVVVVVVVGVVVGFLLLHQPAAAVPFNRKHEAMCNNVLLHST